MSSDFSNSVLKFWVTGPIIMSWVTLSIGTLNLGILLLSFCTYRGCICTILVPNILNITYIYSKPYFSEQLIWTSYLLWKS